MIHACLSLWVGIFTVCYPLVLAFGELFNFVDCNISNCSAGGGTMGASVTKLQRYSVRD